MNSLGESVVFFKRYLKQNVITMYYLTLLLYLNQEIETGDMFASTTHIVRNTFAFSRSMLKNIHTYNRNQILFLNVVFSLAKNDNKKKEKEDNSMNTI